MASTVSFLCLCFVLALFASPVLCQFSFMKQAWQGGGDMWKAYQDMREANYKGADKYFHARGNYDAAQRGPGGKWVAGVISDAREGWQGGVSGRGAEDSAADQAANKWVADQNAGMNAESTHRLALNLLKILTKNEPGNIVISPLAIASTLSMLYRGASGDTAEEIIWFLGLSPWDLPSEELDASFDHLLAFLDQTTEAYKLEWVNAAFLQHTFPVRYDYKKTMEKSYHAKILHEEFTTNRQSAVNRMNEWVERETRGKITGLIKHLGSYSGLVLLNAIYFMGTWERRFEKTLTTPKRFYNKGTEVSSKEVDMMHLVAELNHAELDNYRVLELPYRGNEMAMLILLPKSLDGLEKMEASLKPDFLRNLKRQMQKGKVRVSLPKFQIEYSKPLKETLHRLGIRKVFESGADLSGISYFSRLRLAYIIHKAVIKVNEEGTVAAEGTNTDLVGAVEFNVDHPFLFIICDTRNHTNLFTGRVVEL